MKKLWKAFWKIEFWIKQRFGYILRIDPKDENVVLGLKMETFVAQKWLKDAWCKDGIPTSVLGSFYESKYTIKVKYVFPVLILFPIKNKYWTKK